MIEIIGAPFDLCGMRLGSRLGPAALRLAGLRESLEALGLDVADGGDVQPGPGDPEEGGMRSFAPLLEMVRALQARARETLVKGAVPLILGGEHTLAVAGIGAALEEGDDLAVLWIDAHADANTPGTSHSGNIHGMPLAALWGLESGAAGVVDRQWRALRDLLGPACLRPEWTAWYGLRDVDPAERPRLNGLALTMHDIDRRGVDATMGRFHEWLRGTGATRLWISFDVDALDPVLAPGTGTAVRGGLTYREAHLVAELLREGLDAPGCPYRLAGVDLVETNPLVDRFNETAAMGVEWAASLFGKRILGRAVDSSQ